jgi:8-oxo-dGTP pyrophosphatase MutT (NUDIX family)
MSFEPQKFFVGLIDFFAVWIPGALLTYLLLGGIKLSFWDPARFQPLQQPGSIIVFLFASYLLGHFIFLLGAGLLDHFVYDPIRRATRKRLIKSLAKGKKCSGALPRFLAALMVKARADEAVDRAKKIKDHFLDPLAAANSINAFQWSKARLMLEKPQALEVVQRFEADSKFFRSLLIVLGLLLGWASVENARLMAPLAALGVLAFWRYMDQRLKATTQAYWYVITLESQRENGYRPVRSITSAAPTHAGGAVYRERGERVEYLLVQARKAKDHWVLPKGHIEEEESPQQAAVREVHEETNVWARVEKNLGITSFTRKGETQEVQFYLMHAATKAKRREGRHYVWLPLEEAITRATHSESRDVLRVAEVARASLI